MFSIRQLLAAARCGAVRWHQRRCFGTVQRYHFETVRQALITVGNTVDAACCARSDTRAAARRAIVWYVRARVAVGSAMTTGTPSSAPTRIRISSGNSSSSSLPYWSAMRCAPPAAEDVLFMTALAADMQAHVLDDPEHRHVDFLEHAQPLASIQQRQVLRRSNNQRGGYRHPLRQGQMDVAGARRQVDDSVLTTY